MAASHPSKVRISDNTMASLIRLAMRRGFGGCSTWSVYDGQVWAELVLNFDNDFLGPKLLLSLQPLVLTLNVILLCKKYAELKQ